MADAADRFYPKQRLTDAQNRPRTPFSGPWFGPDVREQVRGGDFPPYAERQSRESREGLREWNDREIAYRIARTAMNQRTGQRSGRITGR